MLKCFYLLFNERHHQDSHSVQYIFTNIVYLPKPTIIIYISITFLFYNYPTRYIYGFNNYFIGNDKQLYLFKKRNFSTQKIVHKKYSKGYYFPVKFYILTKLKTLLIKI